MKKSEVLNENFFEPVLKMENKELIDYELSFEQIQNDIDFNQRIYEEVPGDYEVSVNEYNDAIKYIDQHEKKYIKCLDIIQRYTKQVVDKYNVLFIDKKNVLPNNTIKTEQHSKKENTFTYYRLRVLMREETIDSINTYKKRKFYKSITKEIINKNWQTLRANLTGVKMKDITAQQWKELFPKKKFKHFRNFLGYEY